MRGRLRIVDTTPLDSSAGELLSADFLSAADMAQDGILLYRDLYMAGSDERLAVRQDPIALVEPDEMADVVSVEVDGMEFAAWDGDVFQPTLLASLFDEDGEFCPPETEGVSVFYESGSYESITATRLLYGEGHLAQDDIIDWSALAEGGSLTWDRGTWARGEPGLLDLRPEPFAVLEYDEAQRAVAVTVDGAAVWPPEADGEEEEDGEEDAEEREGPHRPAQAPMRDSGCSAGAGAEVPSS